MKRLSVLGAALVLALLVGGMFVGTLGAQTAPQDTVPGDDPSDADKVYEVCEPAQEEIEADALPRVEDEDGNLDEADERTLAPENCPVQGRDIIDVGGIGSSIPDVGEGVHAEALKVDGPQELGLAHLEDGTVELYSVGGDSQTTAIPAGDGDLADGASPGACSDTAYNLVNSEGNYKVYGTLNWLYNRGTTTSELTVAQAEDAIRDGGVNITTANNNCGLGDNVSAMIQFQGDTNALPESSFSSAGISCNPNDGKSVVAFGDLPSGTLAVECTNIQVRDGFDAVLESDIEINKVKHQWTTNPSSPSCKEGVQEFSLGAVMTHERGHSFGIAHVSEDTHSRLTMSTGIGACDQSAFTLGQGDVRGLRQKY